MRCAGDIFAYLEACAPLAWAESWDSAGFLVGDLAHSYDRCVVAIDLTPALLSYENTLFIVHHPPIFKKGLEHVLAGSLIYEMIKRGNGVLAMHTNFDRAFIPYQVAEALGFQPCGRILDGLSLGLTPGIGYGIWGECEAQSSELVSQAVSKLFGLSALSVYGDPKRLVSRIAFAAGSVGSMIPQDGCDLFIGGEIGYHQALAASHRNMTVFGLGHTESECFFIDTLVSWLKAYGVQADAYRVKPHVRSFYVTV